MGNKDSGGIDPENLESVLYYDDLPEHFIARARSLFPVVKKLFPGLSFKDWINGFKYDLYPEKELAKWEDKVKQYLDKAGSKKESPGMNKGIWERVLNKMNNENDLRYLLKENAIEFEEDDEDRFENRHEPDDLYPPNG